MAVPGWLSTFGKDFKAVFTWLSSSKGQTVIAAGEAIVEGAVPSAAIVINLVNSWMAKIISTETLAAAAASQNGTGAQKAAMVLQAMAPEIGKYFPTANATQIATINTALVTILNTLGAPATPTPAPTAGTTQATVNGAPVTGN
jgi:hypothetical protein